MAHEGATQSLVDLCVCVCVLQSTRKTGVCMCVCVCVCWGGEERRGYMSEGWNRRPLQLETDVVRRWGRRWEGGGGGGEKVEEGVVGVEPTLPIPGVGMTCK